MFKILDRYIVREVLLPFFLSLLVLTFLLQIRPILEQGEPLVAKGIGWMVVARLLATLLPQALGLTIPMALLVGILWGFSRLSADREFVAMQACGISIFRMLRPIALLAAIATASTAYVMIVALPDENQKFREITFNILASSAEGDVKPRVFFQGLGANRVLYVRDVVSAGGWRDVFLADSSGNETTAYFAKEGRLIIDRSKKTVELLLEHGTRHTTYLNKPDDYVGTFFPKLIVSIDPASVFQRTTILKGDNEMTIAELRAKIAENTKTGAPSNTQLFTIQQKFAFPVACVVLGLIGVALGVTNRKDGTLGGFVMGFVVIMGYYYLLWPSRAMAFSGKIQPSFAAWIANIVFGAAGIVLVLWRAGIAEHTIRIPLPSFRRRSAKTEPATGLPTGRRRRAVVLVVRIPRFDLPSPRLLDVYVAREYLRVFLLGFVGLLGVFYISTLIDMADRLLRGSATTAMLMQYMYFETPRYAYYIIPMSALVASLVTIGSLTKNSELIVMRACGVSLYRSAVPLVLFAILLSGVLFELQERVLAYSNRRADAILHVMRGFPPETFGVLDRRWIVGNEGDIYHYESFDPRRNIFGSLTVFHIEAPPWRLASLTYARDVVLVPPAGEEERGLEWQGRQGWTREFTIPPGRNPRNTLKYTPFAAAKLLLEPPSYFKTEEPDAERMTYDQLERYIAQLRASGFQVVPYMVQLQRKVAFPFVTLIMTLLAVPFAVTTGRRGALYGVGVGIVLAIVYWTTQSVFGAVGAGGLISPVLAAWAANILFGAAAVYMMLTVRT
jgi:LPS export ABC transporter permease LptG/LPS export ABC transporter permease LptF